ncbi:unnamed protein product [Phytomonas sp. EM1]|nr:unnamed protein product [Phytomonas sp. EM1]|eukprot:CCW59599.1 unnamed protein product [Phytomonas sp. isolate EM1]
MANIVELDQILRNVAIVDEETLGQWIVLSDIANASVYFNANVATSFAAVRNISDIIVTRYLNNSNQNEVSLHCKTKFCILLNNFALYQPVRKAVFAALEKLTGVFETSIAAESRMPFESELGRMSEHVLVLLMRCTDYNLKAAAIHEFTEGQTQFAIQLLLAILLKEPPYEFDLRCNCITGIYGFTHPQAFFTPEEDIRENSCAKFTEKIDFILNHMLRLKATQVINEVLKEAILEKDTNPIVLRRGVSDMMRSIMNIFKFSSNNSSQWRKHVILHTRFMHEAVVMHTQSLVKILQKQVMEVPFIVSMDLLKALILTLRFCVFASYRLGSFAVQLRSYYSSLVSLFELPIQTQLADARQSRSFIDLYIAALHFLCNMNALDDTTPLEERVTLVLGGDRLAHALEVFLNNEVAVCGMPVVQAWHRQFLENALEWPHESQNTTYNRINSIFENLLRREQAAAAPTAARLPASQHPAEMASGKGRESDKAAGGGPGASVGDFHSKAKPEPHAAPMQEVDTNLRCVLTGELMKNPVRSPYGHSFDKAAILSWFDQNGSVCPITGKPLVASQLVPDTVMGAKIMQQIITQSMATQLTDDDLYNF